jgi:hypothetical protein
MENVEEWVQIRCPYGPRELLMKLRKANEHIPIVEDNLMELYCSFCSRMSRKQDPTVKRVVHRYNLLGEMVESITQRD